ncbi:hypothetical protein P4H09_29530 [Bacillus cereus]|nr:hypothetical protein [Bacillus cereus]
MPKKGACCGKCAAKRNADRLRATIEEMYLIANERVGKCLSEKYMVFSRLNIAKEVGWIGEGNFTLCH